MSTQYDDIINLPHYTSKRRKPMDMKSRAAQFAPFAALTGHNAAIAETARITFKKIELSEDELTVLARKVNFLMALQDSQPVNITYFKSDEHKSGGEYVTVRGKVKKIEKPFNLMILEDGRMIRLDAISDISGAVFDGLEF